MSRPDINPSLYRLDDGKAMQEGDSLIQIKDSQKVSLINVKREFDSFEQINMEDEKHKREILSMFPDYLVNDADQADKDLFHAVSRYDKHNHTFVVGCFDNKIMDFQLISYKYKFLGGVKWRTKGGTSPNGTALVRIYSDDDPIFVLEGHKDSLAAILLGLDFIMLPYAGYRNLEPVDLQKEVLGRDVVFLVEDKQAFDCMKKLSRSLSETASSIVLKQLDDTRMKVDLSDYVQQYNNIKEASDGLRN